MVVGGGGGGEGGTETKTVCQTVANEVKYIKQLYTNVEHGSINIQHFIIC